MPNFMLGSLTKALSKRAQGTDTNTHPPLRVLTYKNLFTTEMKAELTSDMASYQNSTIELIEVGTPEELWEKLEKPGAEGAADVVTLFSFQVPLATQLGWLQPVDRKQVPLIRTIGADFTDLPGDPSLKQVLPILWGVDGMALDTTAASDGKLKGFSANWPNGPGDTVSWTESLGNAALKGKIGLPISTITAWRLAAIERQNENAADHEDVVDSEGNPSARTKSKSKRNSKPQTSSLAKALQPWFNFAQFSDSYWSAVPLLSGDKPPVLILASSGEMAFAPLNEKQWRFSPPKEKGTFWYLSFALGRDAHDDRQAYIFLNAILQKQLSQRFVELTHQASTNSELEREKIDPRLKPSYLRQIPLNGFILWQDFSRAREIRGIMNDALRK